MIWFKAPESCGVVYQTILIRGQENGYETQQSSLLDVFALFFGLDRAQNTIVVYTAYWRTNQ